MKWPLRLASAMLLLGILAAGAIAWSPAHTTSGATCGGALKVVLKYRQRSGSVQASPYADQSNASAAECEAAAELQLARAAGVCGIFVTTAIALAFFDQYRRRSGRPPHRGNGSRIAAPPPIPNAASGHSVPPIA